MRHDERVIPDELYRQIEQSMPIVCVDFLLRRRTDSGTAEIGLIRRASPYGEVWCHLGGRVRRGETLAQALRRHYDESLSGGDLVLGSDPQPAYVYQWFPDAIRPDVPIPMGHDERKHAVGLSFVLDVDGTPSFRPGGEGLELRFAPVHALPEPLWPGCAELFARLLG